MIDGKDAKNVMPCALEALSKFGEHPQILHHFTTLNLYKRQPGLGVVLLYCSKFGLQVFDQHQSMAINWLSYEMNGWADWMRIFLF